MLGDAALAKTERISINAGGWHVEGQKPWGKPVKLEDFEADRPVFFKMKLFETSNMLNVYCLAGFLPSTEVSQNLKFTNLHTHVGKQDLEFFHCFFLVVLISLVFP